MDRRNFLKSGTFFGMTSFVYGVDRFGVNNKETRSVKKRKLVPVITSEWWLIGAAPKDLSSPPPDEIQRLVEDRRKLSNRMDKQYDDYGQILANQLAQIEPVDHHLFQGPDGYWHLWGCVRNTSFGRILYH
jgi:hypothetical protein